MFRESRLSLTPSELIIKWLWEKPSKGQVLFIDGILREMMDSEIDPPKIAELQLLWHVRAQGAGLELESTQDVHPGKGDGGCQKPGSKTLGVS